MPFILASSSAGTGIRYTVAAADSLLIPSYATVFSSDSIGVSVTGAGSSVFVQGTVAGTTGISTGNTAILNGVFVHVVAGASVFGSDNGILAVGSQSYFLNEGTISGGSPYSNGMRLGVLSNSATGASGTMLLVNRGTISGAYAIDWASSGSGSTLTLINSGTLTGTLGAIRAPTLTATVLRNSGEIIGDVTLSSMGDIFDTRNGSVQGTVFGIDGNDVFIGNANSAEIFNGGAGVDVLDFRNGGSVIVALDLSRPNSGQALGDQYFQFENIFGSQQNDILTGDNTNNVLTGEDGNDWLHGRGGNDILRGGLGADTLAGGIGNDNFQFLNPNEGGDTIMDFANVGGNNDFFHVSAAGFGGGLAAGWLAAAAFQAGTGNVASSASVRFIHDTATNTVWYDADGNGAGAAVLLATLQTTVTLTNLDFLVF
ncbi:calcium-binding protein [Pseudogemmobacter bohemicus]|uniref:calcium-binding protein n=1 Tax=Pseudogemmobacter bohemicus TaxID=2250708 RepID=UPI000DD4178B|nr:calcium-binding protein [Pseudogemmobacter bohemicus]